MRTGEKTITGLRGKKKKFASDTISGEEKTAMVNSWKRMVKDKRKEREPGTLTKGCKKGG